MRKRLVRKAFDMILGISMSENREVYYYSENRSLYTQFSFNIFLSCRVARINLGVEVSILYISYQLF